VFLVDVLSPSIGLEGVVEQLKDVFESSSVLKIIHDCRQDSDALFHLAGIRFTNVFDLQVRRKPRVALSCCVRCVLILIGRLDTPHCFENSTKNIPDTNLASHSGRSVSRSGLRRCFTAWCRSRTCVAHERFGV
jgi:hypothetical protein